MPTPAIFNLIIRPTLRPETRSWLARASGGNVNSTHIRATNRFIISAESAGILSKISRVNLFCGDLTAALVPLINTLGNATDTNNNFVSEDVSYLGLTGNGSTKRLSTGVNNNAYGAQNVKSIGVHASSIGSVGSLEVLLGNVAGFGFSRIEKQTTGNVGVRLNSQSVYNTGVAMPTGFICAYRTGGTNVTANIGSSSVSSTTNPSAAQGNEETTIFSASTFNYSTCTLGAYYMGTLQSAAERTAFSRVMQDTMSFLGRPI